jgi:hypothetical protein
MMVRVGSSTAARKLRATAAEPKRRKRRRKKAGTGLTAVKRSRQRRGSPRRRHGRRHEEKRAAASLPHEGSTEQQAKVAYVRGYADGRYEGGEQLLEQAAPPGLMLAGVDLRQVIALGVEALRPTLIPVVDAGTVWNEMEEAIQNGQPYSVVRLGDGELLALAHDLVLDTATIRREAPFVSYAGIELPDHAARSLLAEAVLRAHVVGVPTSRKPYYQPLLVPALSSHGIDIRSLRVTDSTINYTFYLEGLLTRLLQGRRILAIGNEAAGMAERLRGSGMIVAGVISPVKGFPDIDRVIGEASAAAFDIALVSAGIPAVVIASRISSELGKVALDFGHMADQIAKGQVQL